MVTAEELAARRDAVARAPQLQALLAHLRERATRLLDHPPAIPAHKALLSVDGGVCPDDGAALTFDPWSPTAHRCPRCGKTWTGDRHDRHWARFQHLWLAERAVHLATVAALGGDAGKEAGTARDILTGYAERYWRYPNRDNVLGPSRLFFSTYLESIWTCNYLAAAIVLRAAGHLDDAAGRAVHQVADEAATLIGDYDEGFSNRQTWNNAALTAVAVWFEDEELARRAIEGPTGLIAHLVRGYGQDGMWHESENYHLFALRGLLIGTGWARLAGIDCAADPRLAPRLARALRAPALTALPDLTFPARKDARYGVALAQPAFLELWEIGLAQLVRGERYAVSGNDLAAWLTALYEVPAPEPELLESYLHEAGATDRAPRTPHRARSTLSWWSLLEMLPDVPAPSQPWTPQTVLMESQGIAILRADQGTRYVSLECGPYGGGHGHPDRLHLTLHGGGVHWLPDPGTGSYLSPELMWYRSTLAHNAPRLDGESQPPGEATCECFDAQQDWSWVRGRYGSVARTVVAGPAYIVDVVELTGSGERMIELPWHVAARGDVESGGRWTPADEALGEFVTRVERFTPDAAGASVIAHSARGARLTVHCLVEGPGELLRAEAPGLPGQGGERRAAFYVVRGRGRNVRIVTVLEPHHEGAEARARIVRVAGDVIDVETRAGVDQHQFSGQAWVVREAGGASHVLGGRRDVEAPFAPLLELDRPTRAVAPAFRVGAPPPLDGTLAGFELTEPLRLSLEDQYRRSEDAYPGPADFSAVAYAGWDETALYLAVQVTKPDLCLRGPDAPPLRLDNEVDDIHSDGLQIYAGGRDARVGYLVVPDAEGAGLRVRGTTDTASDRAGVHGAWRRTPDGYLVTLRAAWPPGLLAHVGGRVGFDLIINEMLPERTRRAGQLVWSGGNGWVWLRGDRQDPGRFGVLELVV